MKIRLECPWLTLLGNLQLVLRRERDEYPELPKKDNGDEVGCVGSGKIQAPLCYLMATTNSLPAGVLLQPMVTPSNAMDGNQFTILIQN